MKNIVLIFLLVISFSATAELPKMSDSGSGGGGSRSDLKFRIMGGLKYQYATVGSKDKSVKNRTLNGIGAEGVLGFSYGAFLFGAGADYTKLYQMTESKKVDDINMSGTLTRIFGVGSIAISRLVLMGRYYISSTYSLDKKTQAGDKVVYSKPTGGYGASIIWRPGGKAFWSIDYTASGFTESKTSGTKAKLSGGAVMNYSSLGLTYGFMF